MRRPAINLPLIAATKRIESEGLHRTICDYIAGMTDRYLLEEHARLKGA